MSMRISRHDSRVIALSALFSYQITAQDPDRVFEETTGFYCPQGVLSSYLDYARNLFLAAVRNRDALDKLIESRAEGWTISRMPVVDRCILELALAEIKYSGDAPFEVVLDEAVNLAKEYGTADSPAFINGLLVGILKQDALQG